MKQLAEEIKRGISACFLRVLHGCVDPVFDILTFTSFTFRMSSAKDLCWDSFRGRLLLGVESTGVKVDLFQVPETLSPDTLKALSAAEKPTDVMVLERSFLNELPKYDGFMFGMPTRFGMMAAQMKAFFDGTGGLWQSGALAGKLAGTFVSTGTQQGGQETTSLP